MRLTAPGGSAHVEARRRRRRQRRVRLAALAAVALAAPSLLDAAGSTTVTRAAVGGGVVALAVAWSVRDRGADRWQAGAAGEVATASVLAQLGSRWTVLHDVPVPGTSANIDHVVVGPSGVAVIDSKRWAGEVHIGRRRVRHNGADVTAVIERQLWYRDVVARMVGGVDGPAIRMIVVVHGAEIRRGVMRRRTSAGVRIVDPGQLVATVRRGRRRLGRTERRAVVAALRRPRRR